MFDKIAVMGDADLILPLKALGLKVYTPKNIEEARDIFRRLEKEEIALCLVHHRFLEPLRKEIDKLEKKFCPVISGFSDYREVSDLLKRKMRDLSIKATGSDFLARGKDKK
ncbi:MAG: V-type ATP synthase subunit F [Acidobacteriota bacterium]